MQQPVLVSERCGLLTAFWQRLLSAYRSVLFPALNGAEFALACGQLRGFSLAALHCAELR
jgi:hypothetical protein